MTLPITLHTFAPFGLHSRSAQPPRPVVKSMLADLAQQLDCLGYTPIKIVCQSWREADGATARMSLTALPGDMIGSLASWYEWQHPHWVDLIDPPAPVEIARARDLRAALAAICGEAAHAVVG